LEYIRQTIVSVGAALHAFLGRAAPLPAFISDVTLHASLSLYRDLGAGTRPAHSSSGRHEVKDARNALWLAGGEMRVAKVIVLSRFNVNSLTHGAKLETCTHCSICKKININHLTDFSVFFLIGYDGKNLIVYPSLFL